MKFLFGDIVVVNGTQIGVVVKTWEKSDTFEYEIYNRMRNKIETYSECDVERYKIRHKYLDDEEVEYQNLY